MSGAAVSSEPTGAGEAPLGQRAAKIAVATATTVGRVVRQVRQVAARAAEQIDPGSGKRASAARITEEPAESIRAGDDQPDSSAPPTGGPELGEETPVAAPSHTATTTPAA